MLSASWLEKRKPHWARLEELVGRFSKVGIRGLAHSELQQMGLLYRQTAADLSTVREDPESARLAVYLNQLLGRAHNLIYTGRRGSPLKIFEFYRDAYPRIFRETFNYILAATVVFLAAAVVGGLASLGDASFSRFVLSGPMSDTIERREMWTHSILSMKPAASSFIMTNNLSVAFAAFAAGITAGVGTLYLLAFNGLLFGVITVACWQAGMADKLFGFVAPHGVIELPAIFVAGGAGLLLARGLLFHGLLPRRASLVQAGGKAVRLMLGTIPMLVVAGIIEGFVSPTAAPPAMKFLFATGVLLLFVVYLTRAGKPTAS